MDKCVQLSWKRDLWGFITADKREREGYLSTHSGKRKLCFIAAGKRGLSFNTQREARSTFYHSRRERLSFNKQREERHFIITYKRGLCFSVVGKWGLSSLRARALQKHIYYSRTQTFLIWMIWFDQSRFGHSWPLAGGKFSDGFS